MHIDRPASFPLKLLLVPSLAGLVAWGVMVKAHGGLELPSSLLVLSIAVVLVAIILELFAVPVGIRRLLATPRLRTSMNLFAVTLAGAFLLLQLGLTLIGLL